jgi:hypothetical protein
MLRALSVIDVMFRLGIRNVLRVGIYRMLLRSGAFKLLLPSDPPPRGEFFVWPQDRMPSSFAHIAAPGMWERRAERVLSGELQAFSDQWLRGGFPPNWKRSMLTGAELPGPLRHWSTIGDFDLPGGDIKGFWEPARFDGLVVLALGWIESNRTDFRDGIVRWLDDWCRENPANMGIQWKCGQESSIRLMQVLLVFQLLFRWGGVGAGDGLPSFIAQHCRRISATMQYAIGQDNNHGTSEAAALFAGGSFIARHGNADVARRGCKWARLGRRWLENRVLRLVEDDGSFSQYSVNYHRMLLDTVSFAECWRRWLALPPFSDAFLERCRLATEWLSTLTDSSTGDAPNLGANDGSRLFVLHGLGYRDFRPAVQWASRLFCRGLPYGPGPWDEQAAWMSVEGAQVSLADFRPHRHSRLYADGGFATLAAGDAWLMLRLPQYRFRPSQSDALHLDLWIGGRNLLRDGGTFSYNTDAVWLDYFSGVASHNTIQFDGHDQMPKLSRFLYARWLDCKEANIDIDGKCLSVSYIDFMGNEHRREVRLGSNRCQVTDVVSGSHRSAVLRWRLEPGEWTETDCGVSRADFQISVVGVNAALKGRLVQGHESLHYGRKSILPVFEVEIPAAMTVTTEARW